MRALAALLVAASVLAPCRAWGEEGDWSHYVPGRLSTIIAVAKATERVEADEADLVGARAAYRVPLRYTGSTRPIDPTTKRFIETWLKALGLPLSHAALFGEEAYFLEGKEGHWLAVQSSLVPNLNEKRNVGAVVTVYLAWIGSIGNKRFFFIVNGFDDAH